MGGERERRTKGERWLLKEYEFVVKVYELVCLKERKK
jgi:hypothetical protein